jgi:hypothetical protein
MAIAPLPTDGGCRCGAVRFRISAQPLFTAACHCRGCQRMTGGAYSLSAAIPEQGFEVLRGELAPAGVDPGFGHKACPRCHSWLWTKHPMMQGFVNVRASMLDDVSWFAPFVETWTQEALPFALIGAPRSYPGFPAMEEYAGLLDAYAAWASG